MDSQPYLWCDPSCIIGGCTEVGRPCPQVLKLQVQWMDIRQEVIDSLEELNKNWFTYGGMSRNVNTDDDGFPDVWNLLDPESRPVGNVANAFIRSFLGWMDGLDERDAFVNRLTNGGSSID